MKSGEIQGKVEEVGIGGWSVDFLNDFVGAKTVMIKFVGGSVCLDVTSQKPNKLVGLEIRVR